MGLVSVFWLGGEYIVFDGTMNFKPGYKKHGCPGFLSLKMATSSQMCISRERVTLQYWYMAYFKHNMHFSIVSADTYCMSKTNRKSQNG